MRDVQYRQAGLVRGVCVICVNKLNGKRKGALFLTLTLTTVIFLLGYETSMEPMSSKISSAMPRSRDAYKTVYPELYRSSKPPKILLWTTFFGEWVYYNEAKDVFKSKCPLGCELTINKEDIETSDIIVFHLADSIWQGFFSNPWDWFKWPTYRRSDQIWVMMNMEPLPMLWGDFSWFQDRINWTMSYSFDAEVSIPYGTFRKLNKSEKNNMEKQWPLTNLYHSNPKHGAMWMVGDCYDDARRYRIADVLGKHINIDIYGRCGKPCPNGYASCSDLLKPYKFYLALENSDCRDYISEKFWRTLERGQVPIVAWKFSEMFEKLVPPKSYINVYGFPDLETAGQYIAKVDNNETLYNSYFTWRLDYAVHYGKGAWCQLCEKLKNNSFHHMSYHDISGWYQTDTCKPATALSFGHRVFDRFVFELGLL